MVGLFWVHRAYLLVEWRVGRAMGYQRHEHTYYPFESTIKLVMTNATTPARGKRERKYSLRGRVRSSLRCALTRSRLYQFRVVNIALLSCRVLEMKIICTYFIPFTERLNTYVANAHTSLAIMNRIEFGRKTTATHSQSNNNNKQYQIRNRKFMPRNGKTLGKIICMHIIRVRTIALAWILYLTVFARVVVCLRRRRVYAMLWELPTSSSSSSSSSP